MLNILLYAFPTMVLLIGLYLLLFQQSLQLLLKIDSAKPILAFALTYFALSFLGFFIILNGNMTYTLIWIIVILIFTTLMVFLFAKIFDINNKK